MLRQTFVTLQNWACWRMTADPLNPYIMFTETNSVMIISLTLEDLLIYTISLITDRRRMNKFMYCYQTPWYWQVFFVCSQNSLDKVLQLCHRIKCHRFHNQGSPTHDRMTSTTLIHVPALVIGWLLLASAMVGCILPRRAAARCIGFTDWLVPSQWWGWVHPVPEGLRTSDFPCKCRWLTRHYTPYERYKPRFSNVSRLPHLAY